MTSGDGAQLVAEGSNGLSRDEMAGMFRRMALVRRMEQELRRLHRERRTRGPIHRRDGQEAAGIGAGLALAVGHALAHQAHGRGSGEAATLFSGCVPACLMTTRQRGRVTRWRCST
jgi:TPP-dependent pyruvate/acetoin dehydrogenase alpha subunit